jgi:glucose-6-phosphate 1-dehydrogenase
MEFHNPLADSSAQAKLLEPCILVIFGATGDLTARKLMPALYNLARDGQLPNRFACVAFARRDKDHEIFRKEMRAAVEKFSRVQPLDEQIWEAFSQQIYYHRSEFDDEEGYDGLREFLASLDEKLGTNGNRVHYLATQPSFFPAIIEKLKKHQLVYSPSEPHWSRVIIEKPFGHDLPSAEALQHEITQYLDESQIYRIDHYLGKETVQNLLVFRFANVIFEPIWNRKYVDSVQITVGEEQGIGTRGKLWEEQGMLRDIVQNHMMQLLSLMAMEPPVNLQGDAIRDEKVKVLESIRPIEHFDNQVVRGQYGRGFIDGEEVIGYQQEENVASGSNVESYMALKLYVDNWRWAGVPFYLRAGKRLPKKATEIAVTFRELPSVLFRETGQVHETNTLVLRIQPDDGIAMRFNCKVPGLAQPTTQPVLMDFRYKSYFGISPPEAYERLICDCIAGDSTLFARGDEVMASWRFFTPILDHWASEAPPSFPNYASGTWGPECAEKLMEGSQRNWRLI